MIEIHPHNYAKTPFYEPADVKRFAGWIERQKGAAVLYSAHPPGLWREITEGLLLWLAFQL